MEDTSSSATTANRCSKLPDEILQAQASRSELLKWKLLLMAGLGAAAFGLGEGKGVAPVLLALIPLACVYVDLLCSNLNIRQIAIGTYYRTECNDKYEGLCHENRRAYRMEDWSLYGSTRVVCVLLILFALSGAPVIVHGTEGGASAAAEPVVSTAAPEDVMIGQLGAATAAWENIVVATSAVAGLALSVWTHHEYLRRLDLL